MNRKLSSLFKRKFCTSLTLGLLAIGLVGSGLTSLVSLSEVKAEAYEFKKNGGNVERDWNKIKIKKQVGSEYPIYFSVDDGTSTLGTKDQTYTFKDGKVFDTRNSTDANNIIGFLDKGLKFSYTDEHIILTVPRDSKLKRVYLGLQDKSSLHKQVENNGAWVDVAKVTKQMNEKGNTFGRLKASEEDFKTVKDNLEGLSKGIKGETLEADKKKDEGENSETQPQKETEKQQSDPQAESQPKNDADQIPPKPAPAPAPVPNPAPEAKPQPAPKSQPKLEEKPKVDFKNFLSLSKTNKDLVLDGSTVDGDIKIKIDNKSAELVKAKELSLREYGFNATAKFDPRNYQVFDINLLDKDGKKISEYPEGFEAEVNFPVVEGREPLAVKYFPNKKDSSKQITIPSKEVKIGGRRYIQFKVSHFSVYGVEYKPVADGKDKLPNTGASTGAASGLVMLIGLGIAFFTKKR